MDIGENYVKQTHRNRCEIAAANGRAALTVNVVKGGSMAKKAVKDIRIDYSKRWQHQHVLTLISAYRNAPYFDHYWERLEPFYGRRYDFLADFNLALLEVLTGFFGEDMPPVSEIYVGASPGDTDLRGAFPRKEDAGNPAAGCMETLEKGAYDPAEHTIPEYSAAKYEGTGGAVGSRKDTESAALYEKNSAANGKKEDSAANDTVKTGNAATHERSYSVRYEEESGAVNDAVKTGNAAVAHEKGPVCAEPLIIVGEASLLPYRPVYPQKPYWQVFSDRHPFIPGLSVIDLVFCEGPRARGFLSAAAETE